MSIPPHDDQPGTPRPSTPLPGTPLPGTPLPGTPQHGAAAHGDPEEGEQRTGEQRTGEQGTGEQRTGEQRTVELSEETRRYILLLDGERVGDTLYADHGDQRVFVHTEISMEHSGKGLASTLVAAALADVRARGLRVVGLCPFTAAYLRGHREYDDLVDPLTPQLKADLRAAHLI